MSIHTNIIGVRCFTITKKKTPELKVREPPAIRLSQLYFFFVDLVPLPDLVVLLPPPQGVRAPLPFPAIYLTSYRGISVKLLACRSVDQTQEIFSKERLKYYALTFFVFILVIILFVKGPCFRAFFRAVWLVVFPHWFPFYIFSAGRTLHVSHLPHKARLFSPIGESPLKNSCALSEHPPNFGEKLYVCRIQFVKRNLCNRARFFEGGNS